MRVLELRDTQSVAPSSIRTWQPLGANQMRGIARGIRRRFKCLQGVWQTGTGKQGTAGQKGRAKNLESQSSPSSLEED